MAITDYKGANNFTAKDIYSRDATSLLSKNIIQHPSSTYKGAQEQMAPQNPLGWVNTLVQSRMAMEMKPGVKPFIIHNDKFFLRAGAVHTEIGGIYPEIVKSSDIPQPDENIVTKRGHYLRIIQEESGKDPFQLRTLIDFRKFDHAEKMYSFADYAEIMQYYVTTLSRANNTFFNTLIAGMFIGMTGGAVLFDEGTDLERFFSPSGKSIVPTENYSKQAKKYFDDQGEIKKRIKDEIGRVGSLVKNRAIYDPTLVVDEINPQAIEIKDYTFPDISDEAKKKAWMKKMYIDSTDANKKKVHGISRRKSIGGLLNAISFKLTRMTSISSVYNGIGLDTNRTGNLDEVLDMEMTCPPQNLMVFMNSEDLVSSRNAKGGLESGMFVGTPNGTIEQGESKGVRFEGVPFMLPGTFLIIPDYFMRVVVYFDNVYRENFRFHLIENGIRHTMARVVAFGYLPGHFGAMQNFQPDPSGVVKHHKWFS